MALGWVPGPPQLLRCRLTISAEHFSCSPPSWPAHPNCSRYSRVRCCDTLGRWGLGTGLLIQQLLFSITVLREGRNPGRSQWLLPPLPPLPHPHTHTYPSPLPSHEAPPSFSVKLVPAGSSGNCAVGFRGTEQGSSPITKEHSFIMGYRQLLSKLLGKKCENSLPKLSFSSCCHQEELAQARV